jgi:hypothetical protein
VGASPIYVHSNIFDIDPFFRNVTHNADNTWTELTVTALRAISITSLVARNNTFKNCALPYTLAINSSGNTVYSDYVAQFDNAGNKGVRFIPFAADNLIIPINGDPTTAGYGQVSSTPLLYSDVMPTTGKYIQGHTVGNALPTVLGSPSSQYTIVGWRRLTTGTNHVLNTDWSEIRALTGT